MIFLLNLFVFRFPINFNSTISVLANTEIEFPASGDQLNVKNFGAEGDGTTDDTIAIQKALNATTRNFQTVFFPKGTYLVNNTIQLGRFKNIRGSNESQTIIRLKDDSLEFTQMLKPVFHSIYNNNQTFGVYIKDLTINTGKGNQKAIGIQYNTHNTGAIENVTVRSEDFSGAIGLDLSETEFGPGLIKNVTIEGFDIGIKTPASPSNAVFQGIFLKKQNAIGFENNMPVSIEGLKSENKVPTVHNSSHVHSHLVLVNASLFGLPREATSNLAAIENEGHYYLRGVRVEGTYTSVLKDQGQLIAEKQVDEKYSNSSTSTIIAPKRQGHLKLAIKNSPVPYIEPIEKWIVPDDSREDDTAAVQAAMNSGARTIFFPGNKTYNITDTIEVPSRVRRIIGQHSGISGTEIFVDRPMLRLVGNTSKPISIETLDIAAWPHTAIAFEVASDRPVYLKYSGSPAVKSKVTTNRSWSGEIYMDEWLGELRLKGNGSIWLRQWNPENNPFTLGESDPELTYAVNNGAKMWVLGTKTEAPAINVLTQNGGQTELLGGFFRDHYSPDEYKPEVPYLITKNASTSASYLQYAWAPGKARNFQALEIQNDRQEKVVIPGLVIMDLYRSTLEAD
ncbi:glycoside hydrolase family 55 protein [Myxosarcina sp. GI1]|uniref:glycoside hydrolase family 55 protein n=1 Tax=Myxosarcina sp. GI1 TaxID=1541065 RepID=UPI00155A53E2|nr:glycoside hydrolase family 55 protein [Myxosarcina sp. GI1]